MAGAWQAVLLCVSLAVTVTLQVHAGGQHWGVSSGSGCAAESWDTTAKTNPLSVQGLQRTFYSKHVSKCNT